MSNKKDGRFTNGTRLTLRLPAGLREAVAAIVSQGKCSQNDFVIEAIREKLEGEVSTTVDTSKV